jgi:flavin reductase ActVB
MTESSAAFREALSHFATGVVVVATRAPGGLTGFTASAFSSLSLDPPLVLVCIGKKATAHHAVVNADLVGISVLAAGQRWIAEQFAQHGVDRFRGVPLVSDAPVPLVDGAIAQLECARHELHDAGDHTIFIALVRHARTVPGRPLVHYARAFGGFAPEQGHGAQQRRDATEPRTTGMSGHVSLEASEESVGVSPAATRPSR